MDPSWLSVIPPTLIFFTACITKRVILSFFIGIITAALIVNQLNIFYACVSISKKIILYISDFDTVFLYIFLLGVGVLISFFSITRARYQEKKSKNKKSFTARSIELLACAIAPFFCIDDYLGLLTIGFIMKELVHSVKISKERLAFFLQSLGAPLVILIPISSWAAAIIAQLEQSGIKDMVFNGKSIADPLFLYMQSIPYIFYSFFLLFSLLFFVATQIKLEQSHNQHFFQDKNTTKEAHITIEQLRDIFISVIFLVFTVIFGILLSGGFPQKNIIDALAASSAPFLVLSLCTWITLAINIMYAMQKERFFFHETITIIKQGFVLMRQSMVIIFFSAIFGQFVRYDLHTGTFLAPFIFGHASIELLPFITFVSSLLVTLFIGNGWATFALFIPLIIPVIQSLDGTIQSTTLTHILGALFSGGVCGNQVSPFAETTNMTSYMIHLSPFQHAKTQAIYVLPAIMATGIAYLCLGNLWFLEYQLLKIAAIGVTAILAMSVIIRKILQKS